MIYNMWMLATFDEAKERLKKMSPDMSTRKNAIISSFIAAGFVVVGALPLDNLKTKI
jgi:hypothetical protein